MAGEIIAIAAWPLFLLFLLWCDFRLYRKHLQQRFRHVDKARVFTIQPTAEGHAKRKPRELWHRHSD